MVGVTVFKVELLQANKKFGIAYMQRHCIEVAQGGVSSRAIHNHTQLYTILALKKIKKNSKRLQKKFNFFFL